MISKFLSYTEIKTKITSIFAFLMVLAYLFYTGQPINWGLTGLFFVAMFIFDLTTTAINNFIDTKTNTQKLQFSRKTALAIIWGMFLISAACGIALALQTDIVVWILGIICFICGIAYTYGPVPISRLPLGEVFSGIFYGLLIPFLLLYINMPQGYYLTLQANTQTIGIQLNIMPLAALILLSIAPMFTTANIMLANNICDVPEDIQVKRYTLPYYLGKYSLGLFVFLYAAIYVSFIVLVVTGILPPLFLLACLSVIPVWINTKHFLEKQVKAETFINAVKNYVLIMGMMVVALVVCGIWG